MPKIRVKAAPGRECPLHARDYAAPGGGHSVLRGDEVIEVESTPGIRRRLAAGDLVEVKDAPAPDTLKPARKE